MTKEHQPHLPGTEPIDLDAFATRVRRSAEWRRHPYITQANIVRRSVGLDPIPSELPPADLPAERPAGTKHIKTGDDNAFSPGRKATTAAIPAIEGIRSTLDSEDPSPGAIIRRADEAFEKNKKAQPQSSEQTE